MTLLARIESFLLERALLDNRSVSTAAIADALQVKPSAVSAALRRDARGNPPSVRIHSGQTNCGTAHKHYHNATREALIEEVKALRAAR